MARFVDLDLEENEDEGLDRSKPLLVQNGRAMAGLASASMSRSSGDSEHATQGENKEVPPLVQNAITEAFSCYPIVMAIVSNIDLNTLDALARTSRVIHDNLIQCRKSLLKATLRCSRERLYQDGKPLSINGVLASGHRAGPAHCARDMVGECRKCGEVVCRNCAIKPPVSTALRDRHRRICETCSKAPIGRLASPPLDAPLPFGSDVVQRTLCKCEEQGVWLCMPCGRNFRNSDEQYMRLWRWRNQYGESHGGLGTGIGDGDRGMPCCREVACLAAKKRFYEVDADTQDARTGYSYNNIHTPSPGSQSGMGSTPPTSGSGLGLSPGPSAGGGGNGGAGFSFLPSTHGDGSIESLVEGMRFQYTPSPQNGPGYDRHEYEGAGGVIRTKTVKMVWVGAPVPEWPEERGGSGDRGGAMAREREGVSRSWCGWCWRAVPGQQDRAGGLHGPDGKGG